MAGSIATLHPEIAEGERNARIELAAAFRVAHHLGWNLTARNHITARIPDDPDHFLMNPLGAGWHEVTASSLLKVNIDGTVVTETDKAPGPAGLNFHSCILRSKPELACSLHIHQEAGVIVSATEGGLRFYDQSACALYGDVAYHEFEGLAEEDEEGPRIVADIGGKHALIMKNHGLLTVGRTVGEAFAYMQRLVTACELQTRLLALNAKPRELPDDIARHTYEQMAARRGNKPFGGHDWEMYMRLADSLDPLYRD